jgi:hypothetical protein
MRTTGARRSALQRLHADQSGLVGKFAVFWLLIMALFAAAAYDAFQVGVTRFHIADVAADAASDASAVLSHDGEDAACDAARATIQSLDAEIKMPRAEWCVVDRAARTVTITVRETAPTVLAGRLAFTKDLTKVSDTEFVGPSDI